MYLPKFYTIGHEILRDESEVCFVPDSAFKQLDTLVEGSRKQYETL